LIFCIAILSILGQARYSSDIKASVGVLQSLGANFAERPFVDIKSIPYTTKAACPAEYERIALHRWHGTKSGCYCRNRD